MSKTIENLKSGNYEIVDNQGVSVTINFTECLEKEFADLEAKLAESFTEKDVEGLIKDREETIKFLKQQLFESGLKTLEEIKLSEQRKKMLEDLSTKNWELEQQLAEKEKQYNNFCIYEAKFRKTLGNWQNQVAIEQLERLRKSLKHKGNVKQIEAPIQLFKERTDYLSYFEIPESDFNRIFDNQIEELKKEINNV